MNLKIAALSIAAAFSATLPVQARELKLATAAPEPSLYGQRIANIVKALDELSGGELTIKPFYSAALGDEQTVVRQTVRGRIDIAALSTSGISLVAPEIAMVLEPYIFDSNEQAICVATTKMIDVFADVLADAGLVSTGFISVGRSAAFSNGEVHSPDDTKGKKFRASPTTPVQNYWEDIGASVVTAGVTDMVPMLKTGAIDGADTPLIYGVAIGLPQLVSDMTLTGQVIWSGGNVISTRTWGSLSEEEQGWLLEAVKRASPIYHGTLVKTEEALLKRAGEAANVKILTAEERAPFKAIAEANRDEAIALYGDKGPELWAALQEAIASCAGAK